MNWICTCIYVAIVSIQVGIYTWKIPDDILPRTKMLKLAKAAVILLLIDTVYSLLALYSTSQISKTDFAKLLPFFVTTLS